MRFAREWALLFGAEVCLLHVVEPTTAVGEFGAAPLGTVQPDLSGRAKLALSQLARKEFPDSLSVSLMVRKGTACAQIAAAARELKADLILIASHGYTGLKRVLLGSTAEEVARRAPCPVLILRRRHVH
jgi:nucleotide-binding universal stress UspA family protein